MACRWLDSSVGRALHWYHRGHGFEFHSGLKLFSSFNATTAYCKLCAFITVVINVFISFSAVQIHALLFHSTKNNYHDFLIIMAIIYR